jgi:VWFA-related protein
MAGVSECGRCFGDTIYGERSLPLWYFASDQLAGVALCTCVVSAIVGFLIAPPRAFAQTAVSAPSVQNQGQFQLKVKSILVVVRVVVRNAKGEPVGGLQKQNFRVFDRGKEQTISNFEAGFSTPLAPTSTVSAQGQASSPAQSSRLLALFFDDLNTSDADMTQARDAADHFLARNLLPEDRVAIFTSGEMLSDFTADPKQIHDALFKLHTSPQALSRIRECPNLSDYQAQQIEQYGDDLTTDAWKMALDECKVCGCPTGAVSPKISKGTAETPGAETQAYIQNLARRIVDQSQMQARSNLEELEQVVTYLSGIPGKRTVVFISPGFQSQSEQRQLERIIDQSLRSQVVISTMDPKGLAIMMREADVSGGYTPGIQSGVITAQHAMDWQREAYASNVLAQIAEGTGGQFFHNSNDLQAGLGALTGSPMYYTLTFAPTDAKPDGKFHPLKIILAREEKGATIQARLGYFADTSKAQTESEATQRAAATQSQISEAVASKVDTTEFPVSLNAQVAEEKGDTRVVSLFIHLDATSLHFHKVGDHNVNSVTFASAVFDQNGKLMDSQQRRATMGLLDAHLPDLFKEGIDADMTFHLKPGIYRIREVVIDSEELRMTTFTKTVKIP